MGHIEATYDYTDEQGGLLYQVVRFAPKEFRQRTPKGSGQWKWGLNGARRVLYRLPQLLEEADRVVFVVEGEKDANTLIALNLVATTNAMGAGKWQAEYSNALRDRNVVIIPDNDDAGRQHAQQVAAALHGDAASVSILELPGLPEKGDVSDWLQGNTKERLLELANQAPYWEPSKNGKASSKRARQKTSDASADGVHLTDLGNAKRVVARHGRDLRYSHTWKCWLIWDGQRWAEDVTGEASRRMKQIQEETYKQALRDLAAVAEPEERKRLEALCAHCLRWEDAKRLTACLQVATTEPEIPIVPAQLDVDRFLLSVLNGTLDLRTGQLREHRREDYITKIGPVNYDANAQCPLWMKCLHRWMNGDTDLIGYLQRVVGYCLTGDVSEQSLWFLHGGGSNGKSTFLKLLLVMLGDYGWQAVSDLLLAKKNQSHPTERADLFGKRFVATIEVDDGHRMAESFMKQISGGDKITARRLYQDHFSFEPTHKIFLAANHKPTISGTDHAVWRRIKLLPFSVTITESEKDPHLDEKLKADLPGILAWAVRGCLDWQHDGLQEPTAVAQATAAYQSEQDSLQGFLVERCFVSPEARAQVSKFFEAYQDYSGDKTTTQKAFTQRMRAKGFESKSGTGNRTYYLGVGLVES